MSNPLLRESLSNADGRLDTLHGALSPAGTPAGGALALTDRRPGRPFASPYYRVYSVATFESATARTASV
jgi:hypothetical protein